MLPQPRKRQDSTKGDLLTSKEDKYSNLKYLKVKETRYKQKHAYGWIGVCPFKKKRYLFLL